MRTNHRFKVENPVVFKKSLLHWAAQFDEAVVLDSNAHSSAYGTYDVLVAVDAEEIIKTNSDKAFEQLSHFKKRLGDWVFGFFGYDLKNELESLDSKNHDGVAFEELFFFQPKRIIAITGKNAQFMYLESCDALVKSDFENIKNLPKADQSNTRCKTPKIRLRMHKDEYLSKISEVLGRIHRGDIYEVNICQEFFVETCEIDPVATFENLNRISAAPFASFLKWENNYALCASPERYLKRVGEKVISQPIKGTAGRNSNNKEDAQLRANLYNDPKERSENVMIVDLVRNDLSKKSKKGSVTVEELFGMYSFKQVHQMISTVTAKFDKKVDSLEIIKDTFPMGSMTGAPKIAAMKIIEEVEVSKRGLYSGAIGYFAPNDDFDFNVVIRSILYNAASGYVTFSVGSAITANSIPQKEYEECLLKAKAMRSVLESQGD